MLKLVVFVLLVAVIVYALTRQGKPRRPPRDPPKEGDPSPLLPAMLIGSDGEDKPGASKTAGEINEMVTGETGDAGGGDGGGGGAD
ncbi:hypothetical protein [Hyphomonas sp.]|uniref:hypothetical protein n=1 Tax=Hyphomonas sp. TaxID=87 RepID=UPI003919E00B